MSDLLVVVVGASLHQIPLRGNLRRFQHVDAGYGAVAVGRIKPPDDLAVLVELYHLPALEAVIGTMTCPVGHKNSSFFIFFQNRKY